METELVVPVNETRYEVFYLMPGEKLSPPQKQGEWWQKYLGSHNRSWTSSKEEALADAAEIKFFNGFQTKIVEVTITRKEI